LNRFGCLDPWNEVEAAAKVERDVGVALESWIRRQAVGDSIVIMPMAPVRDWFKWLEFSPAVSEAIDCTDPQRYTTTFAKARPRKRLIG
jgi:hypothetical protein